MPPRMYIGWLAAALAIIFTLAAACADDAPTPETPTVPTAIPEPSGTPTPQPPIPPAIPFPTPTSAPTAAPTPPPTAIPTPLPTLVPLPAPQQPPDRDLAELAVRLRGVKLDGAPPAARQAHDARRPTAILDYPPARRLRLSHHRHAASRQRKRLLVR